MIKIYYPNIELIKEIQDSEGIYYYSHCFEAVLKKYGYISVHSDQEREERFAILCRKIAWDEKFKEKVLFIEGPCDPSVYSAMSLEWEDRSSDKVCVQKQELKMDIFYSKLKERIIPKAGEAKIEPYLFVSDNPLHNRDKINYHVFKPNTEWQPVLHVLDADGNVEIIAVKKDNILICGLAILDFIVFEHVAPPFNNVGCYGGMQSCANVSCQEEIIQLIVNHFVKNDAILCNVQPWPESYKSAVTIMHDFDRPISNELLDDRLRCYQELGYKATWFWLQRTFNQIQFDKVLQFGHEVALHVDEDLIKEYAFFDEKGIIIKGYNSHGGVSGRGYIGATDFHHAIEQDFTYGQMLARDIKNPARAIVINQNNVAEMTKLILMPHHFSFDVNYTENRKNMLLERLPASLKQGDYMIVMNHPDLHIDDFKDLLHKVKDPKAWYATVQEVCEWKRLVQCEIKYNIIDEEITISLPFISPYNFYINIISKDGSQKIKVPVSTRTVTYDVKTKAKRYFKTTLPLYFDAIRHAINPNPQGSLSTKQVNTLDLESRTYSIVNNMGLNKHDEILELGCGMGFLSFALAVMTGANVKATDISQSYLLKAKEFIKCDLNISDKIEFQYFDYTVNNEDFNDCFTAIILNNTLCYIPIGKQKNAISYMYNYLKPNGKIYFYHPNPLHYIEPFNKLPFVHWLPKPIGEKFVKLYGTRTLKDLYYQSPIRLYYYLKMAGFKKISYYPSGKIIDDQMSFYDKFFPKYYGMLAIK